MRRMIAVWTVWFMPVLSSMAVAATPPSAPGAAGIEPIKIQSIQLSFGPADVGPNVKFVKPGTALPTFHAYFRYQGTGSVRGRWELALPGEPSPDARARVPEQQMTAEARAAVQRYQLLDTFNITLPALSTHRLPAPDAKKIPRDLVGKYHIVLVLEEVTSFGKNAPQSAIGIRPLQIHLLGPPSNDAPSTAK